MKQNGSFLSMYAVTPCHAGSGSSLSVVDNPIQRERHSSWPLIQSSGMKGAMRAHFDRYAGNMISPEENGQFNDLTGLIFGDEKNEFAGAIVISDAKILAFPMRSNIAPFVWITCPAVLKRLVRDLRLAGKDVPDLKEMPHPERDTAFWVNQVVDGGHVLLEDMEVGVTSEAWVPASPLVGLEKAERLLLVHDEVFGYGVGCTSILAQIKIDQMSGTTKDGSLRYQEELPADSIMYSLVFWGGSRRGEQDCGAETIKNFVQNTVIRDYLQVGGDETLGRGIFELEWI